MTGRLVVVGMGPGAAGLQAPDATLALAQATDLIGYFPYLARIPPKPGQTRHASDNRQEVDRARHALELATTGRNVAVVSSGDAGVFAMASAVFEAIELGGTQFLGIDVEVIPGISAMLAVAARIGAPLGHDFCAISLSDNLKPWELIERRLRAAVSVDFVITLYNPISKARPWQLGAAFDLFRNTLSGNTPVVFARAISRPDEKITIVPLHQADPASADMSTLVLIGSRTTRRIDRPAGGAWLYTPRRAEWSVS